MLTFAAMAKRCGLLLDHKTAEPTLDEARTQQLLTPHRARILFCSVRSLTARLCLQGPPPYTLRAACED